jgi:imidazoleglycerol phosphate dehydratase HisB
MPDQESNIKTALIFLDHSLSIIEASGHLALQVLRNSTKDLGEPYRSEG